MGRAGAFESVCSEPAKAFGGSMQKWLLQLWWRSWHLKTMLVLQKRALAFGLKRKDVCEKRLDAYGLRKFSVYFQCFRSKEEKTVS